MDRQVQIYPFPSDGNTYIRQRIGEHLMDSCVLPTVKFGGGDVTVWGAMSYRETAFLTKLNGNLNSLGYIHILENSAIPSAHYLGYGDNFFFKDDGTPCHRTHIVKLWKQERNIRELPNWPPQSPDLNPIENL